MSTTLGEETRKRAENANEPSSDKVCSTQMFPLIIPSVSSSPSFLPFLSTEQLAGVFRRDTEAVREQHGAGFLRCDLCARRSEERRGG